PHRVPVGAAKLAVHAQQTLHVVVPRADLLEARDGITKGRAVDHGRRAAPELAHVHTEERCAVALVTHLEAWLRVVMSRHEDVHASGHGGRGQRRRHSQLDAGTLGGGSRDNRKHEGDGEGERQRDGAQRGTLWKGGALESPQTHQSASSRDAVERHAPCRAIRRWAEHLHDGPRRSTVSTTKCHQQHATSSRWTGRGASRHGLDPRPARRRWRGLGPCLRPGPDQPPAGPLRRPRYSLTRRAHPCRADSRSALLRRRRAGARFLIAYAFTRTRLRAMAFGRSPSTAARASITP